MVIPKTNFEPSEATKIKRALSKRFKHPNESTIFFEVKNGPTYYSDNLLIMDAVAIKKSWKNPCFSAFEIKTSRSDFLNDEKWHNYLDYCHKFYFVCPKGMITRNEVESMDGNIGLMYWDEDYTNCELYTVKAPVRKNLGIPDKAFLYYIIMSKLKPDRYPFHSDKRDFFQDWLKQKEDNKKLASRIDGAIGEMIYDQEQKLEKQQKVVDEYKKRAEILDKIFNFLESKGVVYKFDNWGSSVKDISLKDDWEERLQEALDSNLTKGEKRKIARVVENAEELKEMI